MIGRSSTRSWLSLFPLAGLFLAGFFGCAAGGQRGSTPAATSSGGTLVIAATTPAPRTQSKAIYPIMLGIDVLEADGFAALRGKRIGLLTHPAGVNRNGESTVDVLRRAPRVELVALFGPEHGIYGQEKADVPVDDKIDPRTGLPVYSLYGKYRSPTSKMLQGLDAMVVDLQDIGTRSYTYVSCMRLAMTACFEAGVEFIVLDRPNPLGGLKVDGPPLDADLKSYVGAFRVPYVHGLTIGELALLCKNGIGVLDVDGPTRLAGVLQVVPMRGWNRTMRWPETGLRWVPTSPAIPDFAAAVGYPMTGLGTYLGKFGHGIGKDYLFRGIAHPQIPNAKLLPILQALNLPGLSFRRVDVVGINGKPAWGIYTEITDWAAWNPTELNFHLMRLACLYEAQNPFAVAAKAGETRGFLIHTGSTAFFNALARDGANVDVRAWFAQWQQQALVYQQASRKYWLY
jgi:uncharacterized protein YbbC (DUF1343 family)